MEDLIGTWSVLVNGIGDGTVTCITSSSTVKSCDFSNYGVREFKASSKRRRRSIVQGRSLTLNAEGHKVFDWGNGVVWTEGNYDILKVLQRKIVFLSIANIS